VVFNLDFGIITDNQIVINRRKIVDKVQENVMQAYKLKGKIDPAGNLKIAEPVKIPPGDVEIIILQTVETTDSSTVPKTELQPETSKKKVQYRTQAFKDLLENVPPILPDFDPDRAKWEYLKEKYDL
jgi:hypothetical protein